MPWRGLLCGLPLIIAGLHAQPAFEVASIRPSAPGSRGVSIRIAPGGRLTATNVSVRSLIQKAYGVRTFQLAGGPDWLNFDRYDIVAKAEGNPSEAQVLRMTQALLADRFKLVIRRETKELAVYLLVPGKSGPKSGPKLKEVKYDEENASRGVRRSGLGRMMGLMASTSQLAEALSDVVLNGEAVVDRPVLDRTGLTGVYDFLLAWTPEDGKFGVEKPPDSGPSIFTALQEQLGLKLEASKGPVEILLVERVEKPAAN